MFMTLAPLSAAYSNVARPAVSGRAHQRRRRRIRWRGRTCSCCWRCSRARLRSIRRPIRDPARRRSSRTTPSPCGTSSWLKQKYPLHTHRYDLIGVSYVEGDRIITQGDAPGRLTNTKPWVFQSNVAGNTHVEEGASDPPMRAILMEVKTPAPGADVAEPADGLHQVLGAPSWKNKRTRRVGDPAGHHGAAASSRQERRRTDLRRIDAGADAEGGLRARRYGARRCPRRKPAAACSSSRSNNARSRDDEARPPDGVRSWRRVVWRPRRSRGRLPHSGRPSTTRSRRRARRRCASPI